MNSITLAKDFDMSKLTYNDVKMLDNGGKMVYVSYSKAPLVLQTPQMYAPFGVQTWTNDGKDKHTLSLSFRGKETSPSMEAFYNVLETLDKKLVEDGFANQQTWFKGKKYNSKEVLEALYTPLITPAKDKNTGEVTNKYPATFKMTVPAKDGVFTCQVYDAKQNLIDLKSVQTKGARVSALIQFSGLWFAGGKFGASWRVVQLLVKPNERISGFAFKEDVDDKVVEDDLEDEVVEEAAKEVLAQAVDDAVKDDEPVVESDEEDEDDDLELSVKKPVKKVVMKRKV